MIHVLQSGDALPHYSDRSLLEIALVSALSMTLGTKEIAIFQLQPAGTRLLLERSTRLSPDGVSCRDTDFESPEVALPLEAREEMEASVFNEQAVAVERGGDGQFVHCVPVAFDGKIAAVVEIVLPHLLTTGELEQAEGFVGLYRNYLSLLEYSERDTLTGLLNRRTFDFQVGKLLMHLGANAEPSVPGSDERRDADQVAAPHWIAVIDVDRFKRINERHGHLYGDEVLTLLANLMRESFRHRDKLFRFDGVEFVAVLRRAERDDVARVLDRFRERVAAHPFPQVGQVTVSIGFAPIRSGDTVTTVLESADKALKQAKQDGRNQICGFDDAA
ncbi:MAG: GGDEF domain-containing protein [Rhodocyclaceae bacterium]|nr:GGDEF domain-containing protein [Rhodocyclaceae bacterium]